MDKRQKYRLIGLSIFLAIFAIGLAATVHIGFALIISLPLGLLTLKSAKLENELIDSGELKLEENGGSKVGNKIAKILAVLLALIILIPLVVFTVNNTLQSI